jgi:hypothetical protein
MSTAQPSNDIAQPIYFFESFNDKQFPESRRPLNQQPANLSTLVTASGEVA